MKNNKGSPKHEFRDFKEIMRKLKFLANPDSLEGMEKFGINITNCYGIAIPDLRSMAKKIGHDHKLGLILWDTGIHDARILASMVCIPSMMTERQMERWAMDFDSWDICDQACSNLFCYSPFAWQKAYEWSGRNEEFVKRAGFVLMATLAVHDKVAEDSDFKKLFPLIIRECKDERNFVKKAVNWALRQIGKRNKNLNSEAIVVAKDILEIDNKTAKWIASNALHELSDTDRRKRLKR